MSLSHVHFQCLANETFRKFLMKLALPLVDYDWHRAEDAVQQTYAALWRTRKYDPEKCSPATYAVWRLRGSISALESADRRHERRKCLRRAAESGFSVDLDLVEVRDEVEHVQKFVNRLPQGLQTVVRRRETGETLQVVADRVGLTRQGALIREEKAFAQIRKVLRAG